MNLKGKFQELKIIFLKSSVMLMIDYKKLHKAFSFNMNKKNLFKQKFDLNLLYFRDFNMLKTRFRTENNKQIFNYYILIKCLSRRHYLFKHSEGVPRVPMQS